MLIWQVSAIWVTTSQQLTGRFTVTRATVGGGTGVAGGADVGEGTSTFFLFNISPAPMVTYSPHTEWFFVEARNLPQTSSTPSLPDRLRDASVRVDVRAVSGPMGTEPAFRGSHCGVCGALVEGREVMPSDGR